MGELNQNVYKLNETYNMIMSVTEEDKKRVQDMLIWTEEKIKYTIKERAMDMSDMMIRVGDIWTVDFGVNVGSEINKRRPAVIVQAMGSKESKTVIVVPITHNDDIVQTHITVETQDLKFGRGTVSGVVKTEHIRGVSKARLGKRIGSLTDEKTEEVKNTFKLLLGI